MTRPSWRQMYKGAWPLWWLAAFFGIIFIANIFLVFFATESWTGLETEDAYEKGRLYNDKLAAAERQKNLGWTAELRLSGNRLDLDLKSKDAQAISAAEVSVQMRRPTHEGHDFSVKLAEQQPGRYVANLEFPLAGQWEADVTVRKADEVFRLKQRFTVK